MAELRAGIQESYDKVRELLIHFRTRMHQTDLDSAIAASLAKLKDQTGVAVNFERSGSGLPLLPENQIQVMHIVQECLSNIRKHARAATVKVVVKRSREGMQIEVADDGVGFDPETDPAVLSGHHVGLKIINERAHRVGGQCQVKSAAGQGTRVSLWLPRRQREAA
ncbi:MAG: ATP-binding protein [Dechloromonas sp.]|nr:ATP-binding protein [Dechloromonas sp.]